jgi:hypothetical protein
MKCIVCFEEKKKILSCPSCFSIACVECQEQFKIPACMSCATKFTEQLFKSSGNEKLIKTILRPTEENLFWEREKALLSSTQALVDWEIEVEQLYKQVRFGYQVTFPPKPFLSVSSTGSLVFPCPSSDCRGFIMPKDAKCGSCKKEVCLRCREFMTFNHQCKAEVLETLEAIKKDSKPCPNCSCQIFRTEGCNHMFCTYCRTHFDWLSMKILSNSTNHHYDKTPIYAKFLKNRKIESCDDNVFIDAVPSNSLSKTIIQTDLYRWLWKECRIVREFLQMKLNREKLLEEHDQTLIKLRMQYLRKQLTEETVKKKIYLLEKNYETRNHESNLLENFLRIVQQLQTNVENKTVKEIEDEFLEVVEFFNQCLTDLGSKIKLKANDGPLLFT